MALLVAAMTVPAPAAAAEGAALPPWLKIGGEIRGRSEGFTGLGYTPGNDDSFYLHRLRLNVGIEPLPWLRLFAQGQDSQAPGHRKPVPAGAANTLDLHQGYLELGRPGNGGWTLRAGRQEFIFGEERLIGAQGWGNVGLSFDGGRLSYSGKDYRVDGFSATPVTPLAGRFDRPSNEHRLSGVYSSFAKLLPRSTIEPYFLWKAGRQSRGEFGQFGRLNVYTSGVRAVGLLPNGLDYGLEAAVQGGSSAGDSLRAWAGHWRLGYQPSKVVAIPRLVFEYNYASGDDNPGDGRRGTFDQLYPTNHGKYGVVDRVGWRNIHNTMAGAEWKPSPRWKLNVDFHSFWLATRNDALYGAGGLPTVRNPLAASSHVGTELDFQASFRVTEKLQLTGQVGRLFPGGFLKQSTPGSGVTAYYLMWGYRF